MPESRDKARLRMKERYYKRQAEGRCGICNGERDNKKYKTCSNCRAKHKQWSRKRYQLLKDAGVCPNCYKEPEEDRTYCSECSYQKYIYDVERRENGKV